MNTYNNLGTAEMWRSKKNALLSGKPSSDRPTVIDFNNSYLKRMSGLHGNFMDKSLSKADHAQQILINANRKYNELIDGIATAERLVEQIEQNGSVDPGEENSTYSQTNVNSSNLASNTIEENPEREAIQAVSGIPSSSISSNVREDEITSAAASVASASGGNILSSTASSDAIAQATINSTVPGVNVSSSLVANNTFGSHEIGSATWTSLSSGEQVNLVGRLQSVGYTQEEIRVIASGGASVPDVAIVALSESLENGLTTHPELRLELEKQYGFDIFNEDGSVNPEKLGLILLIDQKNDEDGYDIIEFLHAKYGIDIINNEEYEHLSHILEELKDSFEQIRVELLEKYGFDIFNKDKSVNRDRLTLALLMDKISDNDEFNLLEFLHTIYEHEKETSMKSNVIDTISGVTALGATVAGVSSLANKQERENNEVKEEISVIKRLSEE